MDPRMFGRAVRWCMVDNTRCLLEISVSLSIFLFLCRSAARSRTLHWSNQSFVQFCMCQAHSYDRISPHVDVCPLNCSPRSVSDTLFGNPYAAQLVWRIQHFVWRLRKHKCKKDWNSKSASIVQVPSHEIILPLIIRHENFQVSVRPEADVTDSVRAASLCTGSKLHDSLLSWYHSNATP